MQKEKHPFLEKHPLKKSYKLLIIGTIPPAIGNRKFKVEYYYGNVSSFWNLLKEVYPDSSFSKIEDIQKWQEQYNIGITDTITECYRKENTSRDSDLVVEWKDLNHKLKDYVLQNQNIIEKLIFTSGENCNNALSNFKIIMAEDYSIIADKVIKDLPSPSGGSNTSNFNNSDETLGLKLDFYNYVVNKSAKDIEYITRQWKVKKKKEKGIKVQRIPKGLLKKFKIYKYREIFIGK